MKPTQFQQKVYDFVKTIPKGKTATYKEVAVAIGRPKAYRAVGNALNHNPQIGIIPCHRVIRSDGQIGGYILGTKKKVELLKKEMFNSRF
ncbi:MAG: MGMT family protein [Candidatus Yanofskybacteria bacterium]|nr:MGMT family protein [Candidatus Yanofskybacteria bacterium]